MKRWCVSSASILTGVVAAYIVWLRPWHLRWGATDQERTMPLPGDDLNPEADLVATRAITIEASPARIWPWLVQLGQDRGGFYTYDSLENLVGCEIHNVDEIVAEWQTLEVGDEVKLHPQVPLEVAFIKPEEALVLRGGVPVGESPPPYDFTWAFVLRQQPGGSSRLLVRERYAYTKKWAPLVVEPVEGMSFLMSRKMLRGIRERAERGT